MKRRKADTERSITDPGDTRSAVDDVIDAIDEEFPRTKQLRRDDMPYYPRKRKQGPCPKCGKSDYTGTPLDMKTLYVCRLCGNKWTGPLVAPSRPKIMFLREAKAEKPLVDTIREPQNQWR